jgi:excinuclease UvrABC ATPase subunit/predicted enzyme related to lactoylglutathione lyase
MDITTTTSGVTMTGSSTQGIKTVLHPVSDLAKAKEVYSALLGIPPQADASYYVGFEVEGQHIGLVPGGGPQGMTSPVAYWHVPDIEAKLAEVTAAGATVNEPAHDVGGGRLVATVADPDGNVLASGPMSIATRTDTLSAALHAADSYDLIRVHGARVNNLKDVSIEIPKRRLTVFTGVSGSGKSSLVFGTIAAESQRLINETYSAFVQGFMPTLARPEVDVLEGLTTAIIVDQQRMGADPRSTVGTATDANAMLRILFSRLGQPHIGSPNAFSFNVPSVRARGAITIERGAGKTVAKTFTRAGGMCPRCEGRGTVSDLDLTQLYDDSKSLAEGALTIPGYKAGGWNYRLYSSSGFYDPDKPIREYTKKELHDFLHREPTRMKIEGINMTYEGLIPRVQKSMLAKDKEAMQPHIRAFVERAVTFATCPECDGTRLSEAPRSSKIEGINIADACAMQISDLAEWVRGLEEPSVAPLLATLQETLDSFVEIGLGYLSLDRPSGTVSGGEAQRVKMIGHLGSSLTDVTYVFDEPTTGLHPHDIERMNELLLRLRDKGNTVLVVEHEPDTIAVADHVVDLGPGAGAAGGTVCFEGTVEGLRASATTTGRHLDDRAAVKETVRTPTGTLEIRGATAHNLQDVDVDIPLGALVVVTGVAGSGKSSLIGGSVSGRDGVVSIDQTAIRGSRRSNPATYTGLLDPIRKAFAKANGVKPALFSANSEGACPTCNGAGVVYTDLAMMAGVATPCEECGGKRFEASVLDHHLGGRDISEVLAMSVGEAAEFFGAGEASTPAAHKILERLADVGLGYLTIGQPLTTLSGGERQRLKLATHMAENGGVYVLDEPTTGLHLADVEQLLGLLDRLVDSGKSVIVIEHHQAVMAHADWIVDLGPGAGHDGGRIVFEGTPADLVAARSTLTGEHLAAYVGA